MRYKVFYRDDANELMLEADQAQYKGMKDILKMMSEMLKDSNNFFGIVGENDETLQFYVDKPNSVRAEIPDSTKKGSYRKYLSLKDCLKIVQSLKGNFVKEDFPEFEFEVCLTLDAY